ncbi:formate dehydrogenase subunit alpha [Dissulfurispira thermophila]|uniref:nitrate reductase (cytochrome) n=1 Tax=Dissulfurispira thermophila TaxID=2715679 RepID=A0A7G1H3Q0_9BACT|nr:formate dehydrogenase subunit alpha [Dissulfurispira thermophila]BCB97435.1 formate dehydrogenase subunit alpha [Dissulfurispira thermophila]
MGNNEGIRKILTVCPYCGCGCGLYLHVENGKITGVSPSRSHPVNKGSLCVKGWNAYEFIAHPDRLKYPMIKQNGAFKRASWDDTLNFVATRLDEIKKKYGPDSIGILSSAKCTNEENYLMMKFARAVIGTNNIDHCARLCHSSTVGGLAAAFGSGAMTNSIDEISHAKVLFVIGSNTTEQHPMIAMHMLEAVDRGATLIVADPRRTKIAEFAHIHLRQKSGTDVALLMGIMNVIVNEGLVDIDFVRRRTENFDAFENVLRRYPPSVVEGITGVREYDIRRVARIYAMEKRSMLFYAMGITQHITGTDNVRACANLVMLTGHIGLPMSGLNPLRGQNNVQGACDMGALPNVYSGYQTVTDPRVRKKFQMAWKRKLPQNPGLTLMEMMEKAYVGSLKAMYIMGENPLISDPDLNLLRKALERLDFLVVQDIFPNETSEHADAILPASSYAEKDGTFTNTERRVQLIRKAIEPIGESKPDWEIICELSNKMGYKMNYRGTYEIMEEIALLTPSYGGILHHRLSDGFGLQWPCNDIKHTGTQYLHRKKFARGLGTFITVDFMPPDEPPDSEYPFLLTTGRIYFRYHTATMCKRTAVLEREEPESFIEINPDDAERLGIRNRSMVKVSSRRGEIEIKACVTNKTPEGIVFIPFHFRESAANILTNPATDPSAKIPEYKVCAVKVEPLHRPQKIRRIPSVDLEALRIT